MQRIKNRDSKGSSQITNKPAFWHQSSCPTRCYAAQNFIIAKKYHDEIKAYKIKNDQYYINNDSWFHLKKIRMNRNAV